MSNELYLDCYQDGEPAGLPRDAVRGILPVVEAESDHDDWFIVYPSGEACFVAVEPLEGRDELVTSITISEICADQAFWDDIFRLIRLGNVVLSCSDTDSTVLASPAVFSHLPDDLIGETDDAEAINHLRALEERFEDFIVVDSVAELEAAFEEGMLSKPDESTSAEFTWTWWLCGVAGGVILCLMTLVNVVRAIPDILNGADVPWWELAILPLQLFGLGFVCGSVVWFLRGAVQRLGWIGDSLTGMVVMKVFFLGCMLCFAPELLDEKISDGILMLMLGTAAGAIAGPIWGRDIRRHLKDS